MRSPPYWTLSDAKMPENWPVLRGTARRDARLQKERAGAGSAVVREQDGVTGCPGQLKLVR